MMNDEQGSPDRLVQGSGSPDLNGGPGRARQAGGYRGAHAAGNGAAAQPDIGDAATGPIGPPPDDPAAPGGPDTPGAGGDGQATVRRARKRSRSTWRELPILIVVALTIALVIKTFVVQPFFIPSSSMENTLLIGDKVLVNKLVYHLRSVQRGDIIVFNGVGSWNAALPPTPPASNPLVRAYDATLKPLFHSIADLFGTPIGQTDYIKRVIGVPGDRVACCTQGLVTVNGVPLHESSYLYPGAAPSLIHFSQVVPPGRLWVMGDNRQVSDDSRLRQTDPGSGTIPISQVVGRAFVIVWPPSHWRILSIPSTFSQAGISRSAAASGAVRAPAAGAPVAGAARAGAPAAEAAALQGLVGAKLQPEAPYVPLVAGFAGALPLTWLQRRARRRLTRRPRAGRGQRHR